MLETLIAYNHPKLPPQATLIMLHGLGATKEDFADLPSYFSQLPISLKFIFPQAPLRPVSLNGGMVMPAWYDIYGIELSSKEDTVGIQNASQAILRLVEQEKCSGMPSERVILAGFSQGGAIALFTALTAPCAFLGVAGLSTYLPLNHKLLTTPPKHPLNIMLYHGTLDPVVTLNLAEHSYRTLQALSIPYEYKTYPMEHTVCEEQVRDFMGWVTRTIGSAEKNNFPPFIQGASA